MITVLAEKPSVAAAIAKILGATNQKDGYFEGNGYYVIGAFGHLAGLGLPEDYGFIGFKETNLPMFPDKFTLLMNQVREGKVYKDDPGVAKRLKLIEELFHKSDEIISATDAGREGELIFRNIYNYLSCTKPFKRLWISSLTDKAISEGFKNLKPSQAYENLFQAAQARSIADWLLGFNPTQALTIAAGSGTYPIGRVQTPTLVMITKRFTENKQFKPLFFWQISLTANKAEISFDAISEEKYPTAERATEVTEKIKKTGRILVSNIERKEETEAPPLLYDLTSLQKDGNSKHGFSADKTLTIAQGLYEKKYITYPRTGSRYISEDVFEEIAEKISFLEKYDLFSEYAKNMAGTTLTRNSVNDKKVTDHHALLITENIPSNLGTDDKIIYNLIAGRMLESFSPKCIKDTTSIILDVDGFIFKTKGTIITSAGWRAVNANTKEKAEENKILPNLTTNEMLVIEKVETLEKQTKAKPLHNESTLLSAMENCGKEIEDQELKDSLKDCGIGTPATRASIIEKLLTHKYIIRDKKNLVPTEKGLSVYDVIKDKKIGNVEMTGQWENKLSQIAKGEVNSESFYKDIKEYTKELTNELLSITGIKVAPTEGNTHICPNCQQPFKILEKVGKCFNADCNLTIFRNVCGKALTDNQIILLITKGITPVIKGFTSKKGNLFETKLKLNSDTNWKVEFVFDKK